MLSPLPPAAVRLSALFEQARTAKPTHLPGGLDGRGDRWASQGPLRTGHRVDLGCGPTVFAAARQALMQWRQFPSWASVCDASSAHLKQRPAPPAVGQDVCVTVRGAGLWWSNPARVYEVIDKPDSFSVAYVTLPGHVCRGEERFRLTRDADGRVWYDVRADSVLVHPLARLAGPLARRRQKEFARDSLAAMRRIVSAADLIPRPASSRSKLSAIQLAGI
ncbi:MAG: DUF1990 domain-containing protein [Planctomycetota bacterium]